MSINTLYTGVSFTLNIFTQQNGQRQTLVFPTVTSVELRSRAKMQESIPVNGPPIFISIPGGFMGTIQLDKVNDALEQYWTNYEVDYYKGLDIVSSSITQTIEETGGGVSQYVLQGVTFDAPDFGTWSGETYVKQKIDFYASRWQKQ